MESHSWEMLPDQTGGVVNYNFYFLIMKALDINKSFIDQI